MTKNEIFALGQFTCCYPENKSYDEILELIEKEDESVIIWEPFEYYSGSHIVEIIQDCFYALESTYREVK